MSLYASSAGGPTLYYVDINEGGSALLQNNTTPAGSGKIACLTGSALLTAAYTEVSGTVYMPSGSTFWQHDDVDVGFRVRPVPGKTVFCNHILISEPTGSLP